VPKPLIGASTAATIRRAVDAAVAGQGITVSLRRVTAGGGGWADSTPGVAVDYDAIVTGEVERITGTSGTVIVSKEKAVFAFPGPPALDAGDLLTVNGVERVVVAAFRDTSAIPVQPTTAYL